jgi:hypothetical protein
MKRLFILLLFVLVGCGVAPEAAQPTAAPTSVPVLTIAPTPVPLDNIDLVGILTDSGPLPKGLTGGKVSAGMPAGDKDAIGEDAINTAELPVLHGTDAAGNVIVAIYPDEIKLTHAYSHRKIMMKIVSEEGGDKAASADVGKQSMIFTSSIGIPGTFLVFTRCRALVDIYMTGDLVDNKTVSEYAKSLDAKLTDAVCR